MKRLLIIILFGWLAQSCISARINSHQMVQQPERFNQLLLLVTDSDNIFYEWNEDNYNAVLLGQFNSMDGFDLRKRIHNQLQMHLNTVKIIPADQKFDIHKLVSMDEFILNINDLEYDGILLVHTRALWREDVVINGDSYSNPRSEFHVFLMDKDLFEKQYMAKMSVDGSAINSFNNLFSRFSRELAKDLSNKGFILRPAVL